jgi:ATP-dependent Clp protease ATP-binding subunit ClpA
VFERFTEQAHRVVGLAGDEAEGLGHRYLGPEHLLLGILREGASGAARLLWAYGVGLEAARDELLALARRGVVPAPQLTDRQLLGTVGIDLQQIRRATEQSFGGQALAAATWRVTRRRFWRGTRVVWTPLCGPPFLAKRALHLASQQASTLGHGAVGPGHVLLGVLQDARAPAGRVRVSRRNQRIAEHVGLPDGYRGAAGPLLGALGVDLEGLRRAVMATVGEVGS